MRYTFSVGVLLALTLVAVFGCAGQSRRLPRAYRRPPLPTGTISHWPAMLAQSISR